MSECLTARSKKSAPIKMMATSAAGLALEVGALRPEMTADQSLASRRNRLRRHQPQIDP